MALGSALGWAAGKAGAATKMGLSMGYRGSAMWGAAGGAAYGATYGRGPGQSMLGGAASGAMRGAMYGAGAQLGLRAAKSGFAHAAAFGAGKLTSKNIPDWVKGSTSAGVFGAGQYLASSATGLANRAKSMFSGGLNSNSAFMKAFGDGMK